MVQKVKTFENGFITAPLTLGSKATVGDVFRIHKDRGNYGIPITGIQPVQIDSIEAEYFKTRVKLVESSWVLQPGVMSTSCAILRYQSLRL